MWALLVQIFTAFRSDRFAKFGKIFLTQICWWTFFFSFQNHRNCYLENRVVCLKNELLFLKKCHLNYVKSSDAWELLLVVEQTLCPSNTKNVVFKFIFRNLTLKRVYYSEKQLKQFTKIILPRQIYFSNLMKIIKFLREYIRRRILQSIIFLFLEIFRTKI